MGGTLGRRGAVAKSFCPLPPTTPWRRILATRTVEGESGLYWCRMREGPPNMEGGQNERNGMKFRVGRVRSSAWGRQGRPE